MQFALSSKWQVKSWSEGMATVSGFTCEEILGRNFLDDIVDRADRDVVQDQFCQVCNAKDVVREFPFNLYTKSSLHKRLLLNMFPDDDRVASDTGISIFAWHAPRSFGSAEDIVRGAVKILEEGKGEEACKKIAKEKTETPSEASTARPTLDELPDMPGVVTTPFASMGELPPLYSDGTAAIDVMDELPEIQKPDEVTPPESVDEL
mmetsp:Transcript_69371/g.114997  ORF Transcript_69371/g.114997 Transcript_69371/m.114997 type:complete len:206 (+) Transcript_69371:60-677(+)